MSVTPGPMAMPSSIRNGRSAAVPGIEDRVEMADQEDAWRLGPAAERGHDGRPEPPGRIGTDLDPGPELVEERRDESPDLVDAVGRVAPAIDVDEPFEIGQVGRQVGSDGRPQRVELGGRWGRGQHRRGGHDAQSSRWHLAILPGPCDWSRPACSKAPTSTGSSRWSSSRSRSGAGGRGTGNATPAGMPWSILARRSLPATGPIRSRPRSAGSAGCAPITARVAAAWRSIARRIRGTGS